jgi:hypothetical protein
MSSAEEARRLRERPGDYERMADESSDPDEVDALRQLAQAFRDIARRFERDDQRF